MWVDKKDKKGLLLKLARDKANIQRSGERNRNLQICIGK